MDRLHAVIFFSLVLTAATSNIKVVDNGYKSIVVSISRHVAENPDLLANLERFWTDASAFLLTSTKYQLYFKEIIVVLPQEWEQKDNYESFIDVDVDTPDVIIEVTNASVGNGPYARLYEECGRAGLSIHYTTEFMLDPTVTKRYGPGGKVFVHEWSHFRWGVFDEYAYPEDEKYYRVGDEWLPTGCTTEITGFNWNVKTFGDCVFDAITGKPDPNCGFQPQKTNNNAKASIMYLQYLDSVVEFCDDPATAPDHLKHNKLAPNRQNRRCNFQSAWEVMRLHSDFIDIAGNPPLPNDTDTQPVFRYVRTRPETQVLVLDVSGSMEGALLLKLNQEATRFITAIETGSHLGIVQFSSDATTLSPLVEIKSDADRDALILKLPTIASGSTGIGAALLKGLEVLTLGGYPQGGSISLFTDGKENRAPTLAEATTLLLEKGVKVHTTAIGQQADNQLAHLSKVTGGKKNYYSGDKHSTALLDGFLATRSSFVTSKQLSQTILSEALTVTSEIPLNGTFYIDSTIGRETTLTFSYSQPIAVTINSPNGPYKAITTKDYPSVQIIKISFENDLTPGRWSYHVTTTGNESFITVNIQSNSRSKKTDVLQVYSWISEKDDISFDVKRQFGVYTTVSRGQVSVLNANVIATVERPGAIPLSLNLVDNGIGSDIIKDDGIYTGTIIATDLTDNGRYNIKIRVVGTQSKTKILVRGGSNGAMDRNMNGMYQVTETEPLEDFQRSSTAGEFRIVDFNQTALDESPDRIPPARIMDLRVKSLDVDDVTATLVWTAVGGDFERGQAAKYIVYIGHDLESMVGINISAGRLPEEHVIKGNLSAALAQGEREEYVILVEDLRTGGNNTFFLSVVAVDEMGNEGQPSNVVTLSNAKELSVPIPGAITTTSVPIPGTIPTTSVPIGRVVEDNNSNSALYLAIGIGAPCLVLTVVAITIVFILLKRKTKKEDPA